MQKVLSSADGSATPSALADEDATKTSAEASAPALDDRSLYINREISWLGFNDRVLGQALSPRWPLLERLKFLAIFASNLDEFFMIRVSGLHEQLEASVIEASPDGMSPGEQLAEIGRILRRQLEVGAKLLSDFICATGSHWTTTPRNGASATSVARSSRCSRRSAWTRATRSRSSPTCRSRWRSKRATPTPASRSSRG
jgi:hypothetical protein